MNGADTLMQVSFRVPRVYADAFHDALEPLCDALSWMETDDEAAADILGYAAAGLDEEAVRDAVAAVARAEGLGLLDLTIAPVAARNWIAETDMAFPPITVGRFFIHGEHHVDVPPARTFPLCIGAGVAFGTGEHESTAGCLLAMDGLARRTDPARVLDMGCGTGILALAAARLWPRARVLGVDNDGIAVAVARENARINGLFHKVHFEVSNGYRGVAVRAGGPYDVVTANILARPLMKMARDLMGSLTPGGTGILSGFLRRDAGRVLAMHRVQGFQLVRRVSVGRWTTLVVARPRRSPASND